MQAKVAQSLPCGANPRCKTLEATCANATRSNVWIFCHAHRPLGFGKRLHTQLTAPPLEQVPIQTISVTWTLGKCKNSASTYLGGFLATLQIFHYSKSLLHLNVICHAERISPSLTRTTLRKHFEGITPPMPPVLSTTPFSEMRNSIPAACAFATSTWMWTSAL